MFYTLLFNIKRICPPFSLLPPHLFLRYTPPLHILFRLVSTFYPSSSSFQPLLPSLTLLHLTSYNLLLYPPQPLPLPHLLGTAIAQSSRRDKKPQRWTAAIKEGAGVHLDDRWIRSSRQVTAQNQRLARRSHRGNHRGNKYSRSVSSESWLRWK